MSVKGWLVALAVLAICDSALGALEPISPKLGELKLGGIDILDVPEGQISPANAPGQNPLSEISGLMREVVGKLDETITGPPTQERQGEIVKKLDSLIAELEKECEACKKTCAASANPTRPMRDSRIKNGPGGSGDLNDPREKGTHWAELSPHLRHQVMQSMTEGFPAHYEAILGKYYRRLADGQTSDGEADDAEEPAEVP